MKSYYQRNKVPEHSRLKQYISSLQTQQKKNINDVDQYIFNQYIKQLKSNGQEFVNDDRDINPKVLRLQQAQLQNQEQIYFQSKHTKLKDPNIQEQQNQEAERIMRQLFQVEPPY